MIPGYSIKTDAAICINCKHGCQSYEDYECRHEGHGTFHGDAPYVVHNGHCHDFEKGEYVAPQGGGFTFVGSSA